MNLKEVEKVVSGIQAQLFKNSNAYSIGMLKSRFRGTGIQFKEHQIYVHGDDVRFIDWKLSARTRTAFVKNFEEERNVNIVVVVDITRSMYLGYKGKSKLQAAFELSCLLYLLAEQTGDMVQVVLWDEGTMMLPQKNGKEGIINFVSQLEKKGILNKHGKIDIEYELKEILPVEKKVAQLKSFLAKNKEVVIFSDFSSFDEVNELNKLLYKKNIHCFKIVSPLEEANERPFSVEVYNSQSQDNNKYFLDQMSTFVEKRKLERLKGRVKVLKVKDRYLEVFVKELS
ncbi:MAG: DUF58 domain-containing protein [Bacteriovoracaceae bacterium]|nr:DUF58 domain-containing protein [Bacteriovoracaceae bacterium]